MQESIDVLRNKKDYSNFELIDFSIETFKFFDENGIYTVNTVYGFTGEVLEDNILLNQNELFELFDELKIDKSINSSLNFIVNQKGIIKIPIKVGSSFFFEFYKEHKKYKSLFKRFNNMWFYDCETGLGNGLIKQKIEEQLLKYTQIYLNIHLNEKLKINESLQTIVNKKGSPILYQSLYNHYFICKEDLSNFTFGEFNKFNNDKIKTFENIRIIDALYLYDNYTLNDLGSIQIINSLCTLRNSDINNLGNVNYIGDSLLIENCKNLKHIENIEINKNLNLRNSEINIVKNVKIKGNLYFNLKFKENHIIENCQIQGDIKFLNPIRRNLQFN